MKKIILHIGCGKTGSSALQLWLNNNANFLFDAGIYYPTFGAGKLDDYSITVGNGINLVNALSNGSDSELLRHIINDSKNRDILLSSETFQLLSHDDISTLRDTFLSMDLEPRVIAYVRDVYEMLYSGYLQLIKRHFYTKTFREFALTIKQLQQFEVLQKWSSIFPDIIVKHYDTEKGQLDKSFGEAVGIVEGILPKMARKKVNRSLTLDEAELLRFINAVYIAQVEKPDSTFSRLISDALIINDPELNTSVLLDEDALEYINNISKKDVDWTNDRFFQGKELLKVISSTKEYISDIPKIPKHVRVAIQAVFSAIHSFKFEGNRNKKGSEREGKGIDIGDPRIVDILRTEAIRREGLSLAESFALMSAANVLRPNGPVITKKLDEYKARLQLLGN